MTLSYFEYQLEFQKFRKNFKKNVPCIMSIFGGCSNLPINSHSIARVALRNIAEESHLITPTMIPTRQEFGLATRFKSKGIRYASCFPGFCSEHDSRIFKPIDTNFLKLDEGTIRLIYMRCLSQELFKKYQNLNFQKSLKKRGLLPDNVNSDAYQNGTRIGADLVYEQLINLKKRNSELSYVALRFDIILPFAFMGAYGFSLEKLEKEHGAIYKLPENGGDIIKNSLVAVIPTSAGSCFLIASTKQKSGDFELALEKFKQGSSNLVEYIFQFGIDKSENLFLRPSWFMNLPDSRREQIEYRFQDTMATYEYDDQRPFLNLLSQSSTKPVLFSNSLKAKKWYKENIAN